MTTETYTLIRYEHVGLPTEQTKSSLIQKQLDQLLAAEQQQRDIMQAEVNEKIQKNAVNYHALIDKIESLLSAAKGREERERREAEAAAALETQRRAAEEQQRAALLERKAALEAGMKAVAEEQRQRKAALEKSSEAAIERKVGEEEKPGSKGKDKMAGGENSGSEIGREESSKQAARKTPRQPIKPPQEGEIAQRAPQSAKVAAAKPKPFDDIEMAAIMEAIHLALNQRDEFRKRKRECETQSDHRPRSPTPKRCDSQSSISSQDNTVGALHLEDEELNYEPQDREDDEIADNRPVSTSASAKVPKGQNKVLAPSPRAHSSNQVQYREPSAESSHDISFIARLTTDLVTQHVAKKATGWPGVQQIRKCTKPGKSRWIELTISTTWDLPKLLKQWQNMKAYSRYFSDLYPGQVQPRETLAAAIERLSGQRVEQIQLD